MSSSQTPITSLYSGKGLRKYLTHAERQRFLDAARRHPRPAIRTLCLTLAHTGCRLSEALALTQSALEPEAGFIAFRTLKRRSRAVIVREVPVPPELISEIQGVHSHGVSTRIWTFSRSQTWRLVKEVMRDASVSDGPQASPKGLRHGFGVHAVRCGVPLNLVQRWLGHASMNTTAIYLAVMGDEERSIASRMWRETDNAAMIVQ